MANPGLWIKIEVYVNSKYGEASHTDRFISI